LKIGLLKTMGFSYYKKFCLFFVHLDDSTLGIHCYMEKKTSPSILIAIAQRRFEPGIYLTVVWRANSQLRVPTGCRPRFKPGAYLTAGLLTNEPHLLLVTIVYTMPLFRSGLDGAARKVVCDFRPSPRVPGSSVH
jgi:hypothetical protein